MADQLSMEITAPNGKVLTIQGDHVPTADELQQIFAKAGVATGADDVGPQRLPPQDVNLRIFGTKIGQINPDIVETGEALRQKDLANVKRSETEAADVASKLPRSLQWPAGAALAMREPIAQIAAVVSGTGSMLGAVRAVQASGGGALAALRTTYANANPVVRQSVVLAVSRALGIPSTYAELLMLGAGFPVKGGGKGGGGGAAQTTEEAIAKAAATEEAAAARAAAKRGPAYGPTPFHELPLAEQMPHLPTQDPATVRVTPGGQDYRARDVVPVPARQGAAPYQPPSTPFNELPLAQQMAMLPSRGPTPVTTRSGGPPARIGDYTVPPTPFNELPLAQQMEMLPSHGTTPVTTRSGGPPVRIGSGTAPPAASTPFHELPLAQQMEQLPMTGPTPVTTRTGGPPVRGLSTPPAAAAATTGAGTATGPAMAAPAVAEPPPKAEPPKTEPPKTEPPKTEPPKAGALTFSDADKQLIGHLEELGASPGQARARVTNAKVEGADAVTRLQNLVEELRLSKGTTQAPETGPWMGEGAGKAAAPSQPAPAGEASTTQPSAPAKTTTMGGTDIGHGVTRTALPGGRTEYVGPGGRTTVTEDLTQHGKRYAATLHLPDGKNSSLGNMQTAEEAHAAAARRATDWHPGKPIPQFGTLTGSTPAASAAASSAPPSTIREQLEAILRQRSGAEPTPRSLTAEEMIHMLEDRLKVQPGAARSEKFVKIY